MAVRVVGIVPPAEVEVAVVHDVDALVHSRYEESAGNGEIVLVDDRRNRPGVDGVRVVRHRRVAKGQLAKAGELGEVVLVDRLEVVELAFEQVARGVEVVAVVLDGVLGLVRGGHELVVRVCGQSGQSGVSN